MSYYIDGKSTNSEHNKRVIDKYWKDFKKSGKDFTLGRGYYALTQDNLTDKLNSFSNCMFIRSEDRTKQLMSLVMMFFQDEIRSIIANRKKIRELGDLSSLERSELFLWMKQTNPREYILFGKVLTEILQNAKKEAVDKSKYITRISRHLYKSLANDFITLS